MSCACSEVACARASVTGHRNITSPSMLRHLHACQKAVVPLISPPLFLRMWINDQETQPDEARPKNPIASHRRHKAATHCVSIPTISRWRGTEGSVNLCEGTTQSATGVGELLAAE